MKVGAIDYITKPFELEELNNSIEAVLEVRNANYSKLSSVIENRSRMSRKDAGWMRHIDNIAEGIATRLDSLTGNVISITVIEQTIDAARRLKVPKEHIKKWTNNRCGDIERVKFLEHII